MIQEDRELLIKDLCMRLPYNVYVDRIGIPHKLISVNSADKTVTINNKDYMPTTFFINASEIPVKPYLRPMSSMTKEEKSVLSLCNAFIEPRSIELKLDFYNMYHLDFRGLIEKGLAIEVNENNNPYK